MNYRPASNFLFNLLEEVLQDKLQVFLDSNGLSTCRKLHIAETAALAKIYNELLLCSRYCEPVLSARFTAATFDLKHEARLFSGSPKRISYKLH